MQMSDYSIYQAGNKMQLTASTEEWICGRQIETVIKASTPALKQNRLADTDYSSPTSSIIWRVFNG